MSPIDESRRFSIAALRRAYLAGEASPRAVVALARRRIAADGDNPAWIRVLDEVELAPCLDRLDGLDPATHPLWGIPFAIKDNIDLAGVPTTAACPAYAYTPTDSAPVVQALLDAGAIPLGKTNLDQFATGLVGTRSPYGEVRNAFVPAIISGGSSSGSAVALARGHVAFALGTDTAGSGRVPAALNGLVGLKPSRGLLGTRGVVPACRSLDCVSLFTRDIADAATLLPVVRAFDVLDPYARPFVLDGAIPARPRIGVPRADQMDFFGNDEARALFDAGVQQAAAHAEIVGIDFAPFREAAALLYEGPWLAERFLVARDLLATQPSAVLPVTRGILEGGGALHASQAFVAMYRLQALRRAVEPALASVDAILAPTIGSPYTRAQVAAEPVLRNSELGTYTNFMNLLDLAAIAVPHGMFASGLPAGVTLFADRGADARLLSLAARLFPACAGAAPSFVDDVARLDVLVCGAHMAGLPLNTQLTERGALFRETVRTAPVYRFVALPGGPPFRPALLRVAPGETGGAIEAEIWSLPAARWGDFVQLIPPPLGIGTVELADGRVVKGFIGEGCAAAGAEDITLLGGWRAFLAMRV